MAKDNSLLLIGGAAAVLLLMSGGSGKKKKASPSKDEGSPFEELDAEESGASDPAVGPGVEGGAVLGRTTSYKRYDQSADNLEKFNREFVRAVALIAATHTRPINSEIANALSSMIQRDLLTWIKFYQSRTSTKLETPPGTNLKPSSRGFMSYPDKMQYEVSQFLNTNLNASDLGVSTSLNSSIAKVKKDAIPKINIDTLTTAGNLNKRYKIQWERAPRPKVAVVKAVKATARPINGSRTNVPKGGSRANVPKGGYSIRMKKGGMISAPTLGELSKKMLPVIVEDQAGKLKIPGGASAAKRGAEELLNFIPSSFSTNSILDTLLNSLGDKIPVPGSILSKLKIEVRKQFNKALPMVQAH